VVINFFGTIAGRGSTFFTNLPIRYFYTGMVFYFITCFQCALQVTMTFQKLIHFTDWVVGHAHLVMFGVFTMWLFGIMIELFPRLLGRSWYSQKLLVYHYWLSAGGLFVMFLDLTLAGIFEGFYWSSLQPWDVSTNGAMPFWMVRVFAGLSMFAGLLCFIYNLAMTVAGRTSGELARPSWLGLPTAAAN
jgi:cytochrome c oxidase cbb3-type subunit 1